MTFSSSSSISAELEESEFFIRADFNLPIDAASAKLLYFLNLGFHDIDIAFGAGIFVDIDKANAMLKADNPNSASYGRMTLDELKNKVPQKKDLFVICAAGTYTHYLL